MTRFPHTPFTGRGGHARQRGVSLVEIMVALAVSLFLLAGVVSIFVSNKQAFRIQEGASFLQENARFAMGFLSRSIRMADHWGGVENTDVDINGGLSLTATGSCDQSWMTDLDYGLQGFEGDGAISGVSQFPSNCIAAADYVPNSDILVVRYADSGSAGNGDVFLRTALSRRGVLGQAPASGSLPTFGMPDQDGTLNYPYRVEIWFLRPCSNRAGGTSSSACDAADDDDRPIPTLTVMSLSGSSLTQEAMIEGIEQLQFEYGRDLDDDGNVDSFDTASTLNALSAGQRRTAWRQVISVRVALLARSNQFDAATQDTATYYLAGDKGSQSSGVTAASDDQHYLRKQYQQTLQVRNRVRS
jgi:type IV pilus assembly protein PilW